MYNKENRFECGKNWSNSGVDLLSGGLNRGILLYIGSYNLVVIFLHLLIFRSNKFGYVLHILSLFLR